MTMGSWRPFIQPTWEVWNVLSSSSPSGVRTEPPKTNLARQIKRHVTFLTKAYRATVHGHIDWVIIWVFALRRSWKIGSLVHCLRGTHSNFCQYRHLYVCSFADNCCLICLCRDGYVRLTPAGGHVQSTEALKPSIEYRTQYVSVNCCSIACIDSVHDFRLV